ncbi:ABC transporter permease [Haladaptatus halobius]|uniref:ABC transporter permease n=1 Tax=Haladaptatus halobius TaxID=2884875 RepID=UPI001D0A16AE|nr:ABC transporter permease [Haladaptatus halobius]
MSSTEEASDSVFDITSETELSQSERWQQMFDVWVLAPLRIMWTDRRTKIGFLITATYVLMGTVGIYIVPSPESMQGPILLPAFQNWAHPLGTDRFGQDLLKGLIHATPAMLQMITSGAVFTVVAATLVGTVAGFKGGWVDQVLMTFTDVMLTIPGLPLIIVLSIAIDPKNPFVVGLLLTVNAWAGLARTLRSQVLSIRENSYVEAARAMGVPTWRIIRGDILPNLMPFIAVNFMQTARYVVFTSVALYFLGLLPFTTQNWGVMMNLARTSGALRSEQVIHWLLFPMIMIVILTYGLIMLAQGMDRLFNPRVRARHAKTIADEETH